MENSSRWNHLKAKTMSTLVLLGNFALKSFYSSGLPNPAEVVLRLMTMFLQRLPLPRLVHFIDLVLPQMVPSDSPSQRDSDDAMCSLLLRNHQQGLSEGQQRQPLQVELGKLFCSHSGMLHVSMNVNGVPFLLFASASDFSLSPVADFKSTKSVNTAKQNVVLGCPMILPIPFVPMPWIRTLGGCMPCQIRQLTAMFKLHGSRWTKSIGSGSVRVPTNWTSLSTCLLNDFVLDVVCSARCRFTPSAHPADQNCSLLP